MHDYTLPPEELSGSIKTENVPPAICNTCLPTITQADWVSWRGLLVKRVSLQRVTAWSQWCSPEWQQLYKHIRMNCEVPARGCVGLWKEVGGHKLQIQKISYFHSFACSTCPRTYATGKAVVVEPASYNIRRSFLWIPISYWIVYKTICSSLGTMQLFI